MARALAERGHLVALVRPPLRVSWFNNRLAGPVIASHPEIDTWVLGGHSLGGSSALAYANEHPDRVAGVVLLASRPLGMDLSDQDLPVLALYGTRDGILTPTEARAAAARLPPNTRFVPIEGGNHSNFGDYGRQRGDRAARIAREAQQARVVDRVDGFIGALQRPAGS
jgi:pimeloyl-ACP methyl ester carboxylesterase